MQAYPKLVDVEYSPSGCVLILSDGHRLPLNLNGRSLDAHLVKSGWPPLAQVCAAKNADVLQVPFEMTERDWNFITKALLQAPEARAIREQVALLEWLQLPFTGVCALPWRLYGGFGNASPGASPNCYVGHPVGFRTGRVPDRPAPWTHCCLSAPGGWLCNTLVNLRSGAVEIVTGVRPGHFLESLPEK